MRYWLVMGHGSYMKNITVAVHDVVEVVDMALNSAETEYSKRV